MCACSKAYIITIIVNRLTYLRTSTAHCIATCLQQRPEIALYTLSFKILCIAITFDTLVYIMYMHNFGVHPYHCFCYTCIDYIYGRHRPAVVMPKSHAYDAYIALVCYAVLAVQFYLRRAVKH